MFHGGMAKKKTCKGPCGKTLGIDKFPKSATASDGHLGYCSPCWGLKMSAARAKRAADGASGEVKKPKRKVKSGTGLDMFNKALTAANSGKEVWQVVADDGDLKEFRGKNARRQAAKLASKWTFEGYGCMVREIHEYRPSFTLEPVR